MAISTQVATALAFGPVNTVTTAANLAASTSDTITAYIIPTANPGKQEFEVVLDVSPDGSTWTAVGSFKYSGSRTTLAHFSVTGIKATNARLRQNDANQGPNALKINAWIAN